MKLLWAGILALLFLAPFICYAAEPLLYYIVWITLAVFLLVELMLNFELSSSKNLKIALLCFFAYLIIPAIFSKDPSQSAHSFFEFCICILIFLVFSQVNLAEKRKIILVIILGSLVISLHAVYQHYFGYDMARKAIIDNKIVLSCLNKKVLLHCLKFKRIGSFFGFSNVLSIYLGMVIFLTIGYALDIYPRKISFLVLLILPVNFLALYFTYSLSGIFCLCLGFLIFAVLNFCKNTAQFKKYVLNWLFAGIIIFIMLIIMLFKWDWLYKSFNYNLGHSIDRRLEIWRLLFAALINKPFYFIGLGNFKLFPGNAYSIFTHNIFLQLWAEAGVAGLVVFIWFILSLFIKGLRNLLFSKNNNYLGIGIISSVLMFFAHNMFEFSFFFGQVSIIWWGLCGLMIAKES